MRGGASFGRDWRSLDEVRGKARTASGRDGDRYVVKVMTVGEEEVLVIGTFERGGTATTRSVVVESVEY